jgi:hypothetical protein
MFDFSFYTLQAIKVAEVKSIKYPPDSSAPPFHYPGKLRYTYDQS